MSENWDKLNQGNVIYLVTSNKQSMLCIFFAVKLWFDIFYLMKNYS